MTAPAPPYSALPTALTPGGQVGPPLAYWHPTYRAWLIACQVPQAYAQAGGRYLATYAVPRDSGGWLWGTTTGHLSYGTMLLDGRRTGYSHANAPTPYAAGGTPALTGSEWERLRACHAAWERCRNAVANRPRRTPPWVPAAAWLAHAGWQRA